jgi:DNA-directed RNA polymerase sigma subunit (sigma70/sigma32)
MACEGRRVLLRAIAPMEDALHLYEAQLDEIVEVCADPWFFRELAKYRGGDEHAGRCISGRCLRQVLEIAKRKWRPGCGISLLDLVQEGNAELMRAVRYFPGFTAREFIPYFSGRVEHRLTLILQHPGEFA